jgi:hypothetical protein
MRQSIRLGRVARVPVGMHWSVIVIFALITDILAAGVLPSVIPHQATGLYWTVAAAGAVLFVAALGAHEIAARPWPGAWASRCARSRCGPAWPGGERHGSWEWSQQQVPGHRSATLGQPR